MLVNYISGGFDMLDGFIGTELDRSCNFSATYLIGWLIGTGSCPSVVADCNWFQFG